MPDELEAREAIAWSRKALVPDPLMDPLNLSDELMRSLAEHWADKEIAILDDGTAWGAGVANAVRRRLRERGVRVAVDETFTRGEAEYSALVSKMQAAGVDVFFLGGLTTRQA